MVNTPGVVPTKALIPGQCMIGYHLGETAKPGQGFSGQGDATLAAANRNLWWGRVPDFICSNLAQNLPTYTTYSNTNFIAGSSTVIPPSGFNPASNIGRQVWATTGSLPFNTYVGPASTTTSLRLSSNPSTQVDARILLTATTTLYVFSSSPFTSRMNNWVGYTTSPMLIAMVPYPQTYTNSNGQSTTGNWTQIPGGAFDGMYKAAGLQLVASGQGNAIIRIAIESDGDWFYYAFQYAGAHGGPTHTTADFKTGFGYMATMLKATPGSNFTIEYNISIYNGWDPNVSRPDPSTFDVCGTDRYDEGAYGTSYGPTDHVNMWAKETYPHLETIRKMADACGLPMGVSEGSFCVTRSDGHGGGDNPYGLTQLAAYAASHNMAYYGWFDAYDGSQTSRTQNNNLTEPVSPYSGSHGPFATADGSQPGSVSAVNVAAVWRGPLFAKGAITNGTTAPGGGGGTTNPTATSTIGSSRKTRYGQLIFG